MEIVTPEDNYIDSVLAYHQFRGALSLTQQEAQSHPDTLEVFDDLTETVATSPELRTAYLGIVRYKTGKKKDESINAVREIEEEINVILYDLGVIGENRFKKTEQALRTDDGIEKVAQNFVKLFKSAIPKEELPTRKRRSKTKKKTPASSHKPESLVKQADHFVLDRYTGGRYTVNGQELDLPIDQRAILDEVIRHSEPDPELYVRIDTIKLSTLWSQASEKLLANTGKKPLFRTSMSNLRDSLEAVGFSAFLEAEGGGNGRMYRARIDEVTYHDSPLHHESEKASQAKKTKEQPAAKCELQPAPEQAAQFAGKIVDHVALVVPDKEVGRRNSDVRKSIAKKSGLDEDTVRLIIRDLRRSGDLFVVGNDRGVSMISTEQPEEIKETPIKTPEPEPEPQPKPLFSNEELMLVEQALTALSSSPLERGVKIKSLWLENSENEPVVRAMLSKLIQIGIAKRHIPKRQNAPHSRRNTDPYVKLADADTWRQIKRDLPATLESLSTRIDT